jgi:hypothetical protein
MISQAPLRYGSRLAGGGLVPLLVLLGLLMAPVTCTCGAGVPHGHSLFQLAHHHHDEDHDHSHDSVASVQADQGYSHVPHPLIAAELECDKPNSRLFFDGNFALANAMEQQESAVLHASSISSFGQPMAMAQPSLPGTISCEQCEPLNLPVTQMLEGLSTSPETPPPRA